MRSNVTALVASLLAMALAIAVGCSWFDNGSNAGPAVPNIPPPWNWIDSTPPDSRAVALRACTTMRDDIQGAYNGVVDDESAVRLARACWPMIRSLPPKTEWNP